MFSGLFKMMSASTGLGHQRVESKTTALTSNPTPKADTNVYLLLQMQQAFEAKEFDAKKVMAILQHSQFSITCLAANRAVELLPIWVNVMGSSKHSPEFNKFVTLLHYCHQKNLVAFSQEKKPSDELLDAKDAKAFTIACQNSLVNNELKQQRKREIDADIFHLATYAMGDVGVSSHSKYRSRNPKQEKRCLFLQYELERINTKIKKLGKNDLTNTYKTSENSNPPSINSTYKCSSIRELFIAKQQEQKDNNEFTKQIKEILEAIDTQPDVMPLNVEDPHNKVRDDIMSAALQTQNNMLSAALNWCFDCSEDDSLKTNQIVELMKQLMLTMDQAMLTSYLNQIDDRIYINHPAGNNFDFRTTLKPPLIISLKPITIEALISALSEIMQEEAMQLDKYRLIVHMIRFLLAMINLEKVAEKKDLLLSRVTELMPRIKVEDLTYTNGYSHQSHLISILDIMLSSYTSEAALKAMLDIFIRSEIKLHTIKTPKRNNNLMADLYLSLQNGEFSQQQFEATLGLLINASYDPEAELSAVTAPAELIESINTAIKNYQHAAVNQLSTFVNRDPGTVVVSYLFRPVNPPMPSAKVEGRVSATC